MRNMRSSLLSLDMSKRSTENNSDIDIISAFFKQVHLYILLAFLGPETKRGGNVLGSWEVSGYRGMFLGCGKIL